MTKIIIPVNSPVRSLVLMLKECREEIHPLLPYNISTEFLAAILCESINKSINLMARRINKGPKLIKINPGHLFIEFSDDTAGNWLSEEEQFTIMRQFYFSLISGSARIFLTKENTDLIYFDQRPGAMISSPYKLRNSLLSTPPLFWTICSMIVNSIHKNKRKSINHSIHQLYTRLGADKYLSKDYFKNRLYKSVQNLKYERDPILNASDDLSMIMDHLRGLSLRQIAVKYNRKKSSVHLMVGSPIKKNIPDDKD